MTLNEKITLVPLERTPGYNLFLNGDLYGQITPVKDYRKIQNREFFSAGWVGGPTERESKNELLLKFPEILYYRGITLNTRDRLCEVRNRPLKLGFKQFLFLAHLVNAKGSVVRIDELKRAIWGDRYYYRQLSRYSRKTFEEGVH